MILYHVVFLGDTTGQQCSVQFLKNVKISKVLSECNKVNNCGLKTIKNDH